VGHVTDMGVMRNSYVILVRKPVGKRPIGIHRHRWEYNMQMDLKKVACEDVIWIHLAQDLVQWQACVNTVMNRWVP